MAIARWEPFSELSRLQDEFNRLFELRYPGRGGRGQEELGSAFYPAVDLCAGGGGKTLALLPAPHGDHHGLWIDPQNPTRMINGNDGGATITVEFRTPPMLGADAVTWPKNMGKDGDYVLLAAGGNPEANFPGAQDMVKRHQEKFGKAAAGTTGPAYSVVQILDSPSSRN